MFDRSRNDRAGPVSVELVLGDGRELKGKIAVPPGRTLPELLNGGLNFVEFESYSGEKLFIAKAALTSLKPIEQGPAPSLGQPAANGSFDPHAVLGIAAGATHDKIRQAYIELAKIYHPDRYATVTLPAEVTDYLSAMARRINAAYAALDAKQPSGARKPAGAGAPPR